MKLQISLHRDSPRERAAHGQLMRLIDQHDLRRWTRTTTIHIEEGAIPHSHPILTLNTRHLENDDLALSTYLHEQIHWCVLDRQQALAAAIGDIRERIPAISVGHPVGADSEEASYLHVVVNYLEWRVLAELIGEYRAAQAMSFWMSDHYTAIYELVLREADQIKSIAARHNLCI